MNTSTPRGECISMPLADFIEFFEELAEQADRMRQELQKKQKGGV